MKFQTENERYCNKKGRPILEFEIGDYVAIRNFDGTPGVSHKLISRYEGPLQMMNAFKFRGFFLSKCLGT